jgi:osmotically inducible protein OsmC
VSLDSSQLGAFDVTWAVRAEEPPGRTSPMELIAAAHSACVCQALAYVLTKSGHPAKNLTTMAEVNFEPREGITEICLEVRGIVPGLSPEEFVVLAERVKETCPISKALAGTRITLDASLSGTPTTGPLPPGP